MKNKIVSSVLLFLCYAGSANACIGNITDELLCETPEILFETGEAIAIKEKAEELGSVVNIYEYLRNNAEYAVYHGARSSSVNTFLGMEGNDVDLASTLIAMYRSVGVKSRYAVGSVRLKRSDVASWVGVTNTSLAVSILQDQGITIVDDTEAEYVTIEHVWVDALVNFANYRGASETIAPCSSESDQCKWVALDPSFKLRAYKPEYKHLLESLSFNYDSYYRAESNQDLRDKSPLEIFEESALEYLRNNHSGVTLEDVIDSGVIFEEVLSLLPSSLPYQAIGDVGRYSSVEDRDQAVGSAPWTKFVEVIVNPMVNGGICEEADYPVPKVKLADLSTKRLTFSLEEPEEGVGDRAVFRLNGDVISSITTFQVVSCFSTNPLTGEREFLGQFDSRNFNPGSYFAITLRLDGPRDPIEVVYENLVLGGYYLVATGGETSNWSQVRRAYQNLLAANEQYPLIDNIGGEVYVDINGSGSIDEGDTPLLDNKAAQDALTGGLLYTAQALYYTRLKEESRRYSRLKNIVSPIAGFAGIVSTTLEVEIADDTPFAVLPGGLLIDLKGIRLNGSWEADSAEVYSNETFKFLGHVASSLEHEIWQELTGYDAVSTMRGIQFALNDGADLMDVHNANGEDTFEASLIQMGLTHAAPANFTYKEYELFGRRPSAWEYTGTEPSTDAFYVFRGDISGYSVNDYQARRYTYNADNGFNAYYDNLNNIEDQLLQLVADGVTSPNYDIRTDCGSHNGQTPAQALLLFEACFNQTISSFLTFVNFFDRNMAFDPSAVFYKSIAPGLEEYGIDFVDDVRDHMYFASSNGWFNFTAPSKLTSGPFFVFEVYIKDAIDASNNNLVSSAYIIRNQSMRLNWGGGYVPEGVPVVPSTDIEGVVGSGENIDISGVTFNNEIFTDQNLVALANNDVVRTPSTVDPVSTVTGNMYHDETDVVIAGKGLPYGFTRTYNSNETSTDGVGSSNTGFLPFSQGWTHSYNMKLVSNDYGQYPNYGTDLAPENENNKTSSISYVDERGGESNYILDDGSTTSQPSSPRAGFDNLQINTNNLHTITYANGVVYTFDSGSSTITNMRTPGATARLYRIEDAYGNQLNFGYNSLNQLTSITDNLGLTGRTGLTLAYYTSGSNNGRLHTLTDWTGRQWEYRYTNNQLSAAENPLGDAMEYTYVDGTHWLKDIIHPQDRDGKKKTMTFSYYENGQAYNYVDQMGSEESLIYDLYRKRTRITNPRGFITEHYYDQNGALKKLVEPNKGILLFENNDDGLRYKKYDAIGSRTQYSYHTDRSLAGKASNTLGQVTREQDALGYTVDTDYGVNGLVTIVKDKNGNRFRNVYFSATNALTGAVIGKLEKTTADSVTVNGVVHTNVTIVEYEYHSDGTVRKKTEYIDPATPARSRVTTFNFSYNSNGSYTLTTIATGSGKTITLVQAYDRLWRLVTSTTSRRTSVTDATQVTLTSTYEYDDLGRTVKAIDPIGNIAEMVYDQNGKVKQTITRYKLQAANNSSIKSECTIDAAYPNHHTCINVVNEYDAADRLVKTTDIFGAVTRFEYNAMGKSTKVTNNLGNSLRYEYDSMGRAIKITDEKGYAVTTKYDLAGRVLKVTDANKNSLSYTYDALGRQLTVTTPQNNETTFDEYDGNGNLIQLTDANSKSINNVFDEFNRTVSSLNSESELTSYRYDLLGNRTRVMDAKSQVTEFIYDDLGRLTSVKDPIIESPADKVVSITYDELGNRLSYTDRLGEETRYTYDKMSRPLQENYLSDGITADKVYDQYGDMVSTSYNSNTYLYSYDVAHRLLSKTDTRTNVSLTWEYDSIGNVIRKTNYEGDVHTFTYDSGNRLVAMAVGDPILIIQASYHYDPAGRLLSRILSNGAATLYNYSTDGFLTSVKQVGAGGNQIDLREYEHDNIGNINKLTLNGSEVISYSYDDAYRLKTANSNINSHDYAYTYDDVGNRLSKTANGSTQHFIYSNGNRLDAVRQNSTTGPVVYTFAYDDNGSMTGKFNGASQQLLNISYDQRRLASVMAVNNQPNSLFFEYDANAYRIEKQNSNGTNKYYLEAEHLESVYDANDELQANYLRGVVVDEIINGFEKNTSTGVMENRTFHHDRVNSVVALSDHNGTEMQTLSYGPFGRSINSTGSSQNAMKYTGREQDEESGLYYYRARYYDPELGRFISEDPIGFKGGVNLYAYVGNNPLIYSDPSGNVPWDQVFGTVRVIGGVAEVASGAVIATGTSWTGVGAIGGGLIVLHGADQIQAGMRQIASDSHVSSFTSMGLQEVGFSPLAADLTDAGLSFASGGFSLYQGSRSLAVHAADPLADGMSSFQILNRVDVGSQALNNADFLALGGESVSALARSSMIAQGVDAAGDAFTLTTTLSERAVMGVRLLDTGLTPSGDFAMGSLNALGGTANGASGGFVLYPNKVNTNSTIGVYSK